VNGKNFPFRKRENPMDTPVTNATGVTGSAREKYTATMDRELRKRVKIASVKKGIVFSQFIEEAVLEKLDKEGL